MVDHSVLIVFASLGGEWLAQQAQWFLWNIWEFREDGGLGSPKTETQSPIFCYTTWYFTFRVTRWQWHLSNPSSARLDMETMRDHWAGPWRLNEHVWHSTYSAESPPCSNRLRTWPPSNALIARSCDLTSLSALLFFIHICHHGGAQRPGYHVFEQVLSQFLLVVQLRKREEDFLQIKAQFVPGLSEEERRDPQRPIRDQCAADRGGVDVGYCAPWPHCQGRAPAVLCHLPHDSPADLDDVVHPGAGQTEEHADRERCPRHHMLDKRCVCKITLKIIIVNAYMAQVMSFFSACLEVWVIYLSMWSSWTII